MKVEFALSIIEQLCDNGTPMEVQALKTIYSYINESQKTATNNARDEILLCTTSDSCEYKGLNICKVVGVMCAHKRKLHPLCRR